jgi:hypothetical protein
MRNAETHQQASQRLTRHLSHPRSGYSQSQEETLQHHICDLEHTGIHIGASARVHG